MIDDASLLQKVAQCTAVYVLKSVATLSRYSSMEADAPAEHASTASARREQRLPLTG